MRTNELTEEQRKEADNLIDLLDDAVSDLDFFSCDHDDIFNYEVSKLEDMIKSCRKQLL